MEHGKKLRHDSKNPEYLTKLGVSNGVRGSGRPFIDISLSTRNQTVLVGKQIILRCHIEDVGNQSVRNNFISLFGTVFENHRKSLIQHCERSELRLHFEWTKVN